MTRKGWTIDTWVLYRAAELDFEAATLLLHVLQTHSVSLDYQGHIQREYDRCVARTSRDPRRYPGRSIIAKWVTEVMRRKATFNYSGQLQARHRQHLLQMGFDTSDMPFVAVCYRTSDKLLISEDSDYNEAVKAYLNQEIGIQVLTLAQALDQV